MSLRQSVTALLGGLLCLVESGPLRAQRAAADLEAMPFAPRRYVSYRAPSRLTVDGKLDEPGWAAAPWSDPFIDIEGLPRQSSGDVPRAAAGESHPTPRFRTRAKMLWDDAYFYVAAEMEEPDVWGTLTERDSVIFHDNDFEIFIDPDGDTHAYYELEVNALGTPWDLMLIKPYRDGGPAIHAWDIGGLQVGIDVRGTVNRPGDRDEGWTVEIAMPWTILREAAPDRKPPQPGDRWRVNFSRVQWQVDVTPAPALRQAQGRPELRRGTSEPQRVEGDGRYSRRLEPGTNDLLPENNWVWSPQGAINMHMPERWGYVQFSSVRAGSGTEPFVEDPNERVKWALRRLYYRQGRFRAANGSYATTLDALLSTHSASSGSTVSGVEPSTTLGAGITDIRVEGVDFRPVLHATASLYEITANGFNGAVVHIDQAGRVWLTQ